MIDIQTYNATEALARRSVSSRVALMAFTASAFEESGVPTRIQSLHELRMLMDSMNFQMFKPYQEELGGFRERDLECWTRALRDVLWFHLATFGDGEIPLPLRSMLNHYLVYRKLKGLPGRKRVLDIGPGTGYLAFFAAPDPEFDEYGQIEITQSYYILQSLFAHQAYGHQGHDLAMDTPACEAIPDLASVPIQTRLMEPPPTMKVRRQLRYRHYPWWEIGKAFERTWDVVMLNANLSEMAPEAMLYYFQRIKQSLAPEGIVLMQGSGLAGYNRMTGTRASLKDLLKWIEMVGFRPLVSADGAVAGKTFSRDNRVFLAESHPLYGRAVAAMGPDRWPDDLPLVRSLFGLDEPRGRDFDEAGLARELMRRIG